MKYTAINFKDKLSKFNDHWAPRVIAEFNNYQVKLAKVQGCLLYTSDAADERG